MKQEKVFIGPKLRALRQERGLTQADFAGLLGVSASYINLIEKNQRNASLKLLISLSDTLGIDWRQLTHSDTKLAIADLRQLTNHPAFGPAVPDIEELRAAIEHAPNLVDGLFNIFKAYRTLQEKMEASNAATSDAKGTTAEQAVHDFFRANQNYFEALEAEALNLREPSRFNMDEFFSVLKGHLHEQLGIETRIVPVEALGNSLRFFDRHNKRLLLSEGLDYTNKIFQMVHSIALIEHSDTLNDLITKGGIEDSEEIGRCRVELANYFAAAVMMPYDAFLKEAEQSAYDFEHLATKFSVSFEQACHRITTMQKPGHKGIPFFFLRIDRAGNVTKRFNATQFQLARYGGACPKLDVHYSFRIPGRIFPQFVEMPDGQRYFTINRTVDRPTLKYTNEDKRLAVSMGCAAEHANQVVYARAFNMSQPQMATEIGVNCRLCPRHHCEQRAHASLIHESHIDEDRRGVTRFES